MDGSGGSKGPRSSAPPTQRVSWGVEEGSADNATVDMVDLKPRAASLKASVRRAGSRRTSEDHADRYNPPRGPLYAASSLRWHLQKACISAFPFFHFAL
jgi:hypothetical protein